MNNVLYKLCLHCVDIMDGYIPFPSTILSKSCNLSLYKTRKELLSITGDEKIDYTYAPPDLMSRSQESGKSKSDLFADNGLRLDKSSNNREAGWLAVKELLKVYGDGKEKDSRLKIFNTCPNLIEHLTALQRDAKHPTDCMTEPHDITHLPDALRYFAVQYTYPSKPAKEDKTETQKFKERCFREAKRRRYIVK